METAIMDSKRRFRMAMELLWFASASFGAGLLTAVVAGAVVILLAQPAYALTFREVEFVCPIDNEEFSQRVAASGTSYGRMLDLKPYGYVAAPWTLPVCPTTGFVMYREKFSKDEIAKVKPYVDSYDYWSMRRTETSYYLAAKLQGVLGEPDAIVAPTLLHATWEAETSEQYERYAREALMVYRRLLESSALDEQKRVTYELVSGELERRIGMFDEARARFERVKTQDAFATGVYPDIVALQLKLISAKDIRSYQVPRKPPVKRVEI